MTKTTILGVKCADHNFPGKLYLTEEGSLTWDRKKAKLMLFEQDVQKELVYLKKHYSVYVFTEEDFDIGA